MGCTPHIFINEIKLYLEMIKQRYRFHGHASLRYVLANGKQIRGKYLSIKYIHNSRRKYSRYAVVVSKKVLRKAVKRNLARRRIYEVIRGFNDDTKPAMDMVVTIYKADILDMTHDELMADISKCLHKLNKNEAIAKIGDRVG